MAELLPIVAADAFTRQAATYERVVKMFTNLEKIMVVIMGRYKVTDLKNFNIFRVILKFANELPESFISSTFMKNLTKLLFTTMPLDFKIIGEQEL